MSDGKWAIPGVRRFSDEEITNERKAMADPDVARPTPKAELVPRNEIVDVMQELRSLANYTTTPTHSAKLEDLRDVLAGWISGAPSEASNG